jgi:hypothetical protein
MAEKFKTDETDEKFKTEKEAANIMGKWGFFRNGKNRVCM